MPDIIRLPVSNLLNLSGYTASLKVGARQVPIDVLLDTGSSSFTVDGSIYSPDGDASCKTTSNAQAVYYGSGSWAGAVVQARVALSEEVLLEDANFAVAYSIEQSVFGKAKGILGLAYQALDTGYQMPGDTWQTKYSADQIQAATGSTLDPYFSQLLKAGLIGNRFAFSVKRSILSAAQDDPATDPLNAGVFVIGDGTACTDLYTGAFTWIAVVHESYYNTNLRAVRVGNQPAITVPPMAQGGSAVSNSFVDSGTGSLLFDQFLYDKMLAAFGAIDPDFPTALQQFSIASSNATDQTKINLGAWPILTLVFQGVDGRDAAVSLSPADYWQFDAKTRGMAIAMMYGDQGSLGGQSILGLPLLSSNFTIFDRVGGTAQGAIGFARHR